MPLTSGDQLGHYKIQALIGQGGMGEVYRATDTTLKRDVALKVLPAAFSNAPDRMGRFQREAEVLASLNHPNIAQVFGVVEQDGTRAIAMEFVEGESPAGPMPFEDAWKIMTQVAAGLEYAHERRVVHRDLKPANLKVTPEGRVKILDFGLAKALSGESRRAEAGPDSPTLTMGATEAGVILGTAAYMAPEQVKGKEADRRADIWAFGVVLYELLMGERPFTGSDSTEVMARVVTQDPELGKAPAQVRRLIRECLKKEPDQRLRWVGDVSRFLDSGEATPVEHRQQPLLRLWPALAAVLFVLFAALAFVHFREQPPPTSEPVRFSIFPPEKSAFASLGSSSVSPDGRRVAFRAIGDGATRLWVRSLDSLEARPLAGTEGASGTPFWSSDSRWIVFSAPPKLKKIEASGGPAQSLCDIERDAFGGFWTRDNRIVFGGPPGLLQVGSQGGAASPLTIADLKRGEQGHVMPSLLPDGVHCLYTRYAPRTDAAGIYIGSLIAKPEQQSLRRLLPEMSNLAYAPSADTSAGAGFLLFTRESTLMAQHFDSTRLELVGDAVPVAEQLISDVGPPGFSTSATGVLIYRTGMGGGSQLAWFDRQGKPSGTAWTPANYDELSLSPDGARVAVGRTGDNLDIYVFEFAANRSIRLTSSPRPETQPLWSPDGNRILFLSDTGSGRQFLLKSANGAGDEEPVLRLDGNRNVVPKDWSRDGRLVIYADTDPKTKRDLWILNMSGERKTTKFLASDFNESDAKFSPEPQGPHYVAYVSDESGKDEVYVTTFPDPSRGKWSVSSGGGYQPRWRRDGKELLYFTADGNLMSVEVTLSPTFKLGASKILFQAPILGAATTRRTRWDLTPDGQRFLINSTVGESASPITVVLNWQAGFKK